MTESPAAKPTILVVDDSRLMRVAARKILNSDFEILEAEDGETAWNILQSNRQINLVMSDLSMPNLDGLGLLKKIRGSCDPHCKELPVIIVTGAEDDDGSKNVALGSGASDFITKPCESVQLLARAKAQAKQQRTQQALQDSEINRRQLQQHSSVDPLTGLANKHALINAIEKNLAYAIRHKTELALVALRVDKYKVLFLRRGKKTAEAVLSRIAHLIRQGRRREDTVARPGLDTFAILLPSASPQAAKRIAGQLQRTINEEDFDIGPATTPISATIAVSNATLHAQLSGAEWLAEVDGQLNLAHEAGTGGRMQGGVFKTAARQSVNESSIRVADFADVHRALQTLANGEALEGSADALARAVLPVLEAWDQSCGNRHSALLEQLKSALQTGDDKNRQSVAHSTAQSS
jgi:two-component system cell cycle response regulator